MNPLAARIRAINFLDPEIRYVLELLARGAELGWVKAPDLSDLLASLRDQRGWRSDDIGLEPRGHRILVSFLDETFSWSVAALLDALVQLVAAQDGFCGAFLSGTLSADLGWAG